MSLRQKLETLISRHISGRRPGSGHPGGAFRNGRRTDRDSIAPARDEGTSLSRLARSGAAPAPIDRELARLIEAYKAAVGEAIDLMAQGGLPWPTHRLDWVTGVTWKQQRGTLPGNVHYFAHGIGCLASLPGGEVDFDFGPNGEIDCFDFHRLMFFAKQRARGSSAPDEETMARAYGDALRSGAIVSAYPGQSLMPP